MSDTSQNDEWVNNIARRIFNEPRSQVIRLKAEVDQLRRENAALRADAERYRWIKEDSSGVHDVLELFMSYLNCDLDKEIDQTRAKEAKP